MPDHWVGWILDGLPFWAQLRKKVMKKFWVLWTYIANYSRLLEVEAESAEDARKRATDMFSHDFHRKANIYVFDHAPVFCLEQSQ